MPDKQSVTGWLEELQAGNYDAADALWGRYFEKLVNLARLRLHANLRRVADEQDLAISVFKSLCEGVERGRFDQLNDREDLWRLIATITARKAARQAHWLLREKRGGGHVRGESVFLEGRSDHDEAGLDAVASGEPTPEFLAQLTEEHQRLMNRLTDEPLRQIARWKMEGWLTTEMAEKLQITTRSVERKLQRIREIWKEEPGA